MNLVDKLVQSLKDFREEITLRKKWETLDLHAPVWVKEVDFLQFQNGCLVDVGCHYGLVSVYFIQQTKQMAYGFDINPRINKLLKKNLINTPYVHQFQVMGCGLSDENQTVMSYSDTKYSGAATVEEKQVGLAKNMFGLHLKKDQLVEVKRLDDVSIPEKISLIKIDCEGNEANVLKGGLRTIQKSRPTIIFEALTLEKLSECERILAKIGYAVTKIDERNFMAKGAS